MKLQPVKTQKVYQVVLLQLRQLLQEGHLKPGEKLIPERELAEQLQVSRTSLREALRALEIQGLIETRPRGGTFIRHTDAQTLLAALNQLLDGNSLTSILEMLQVRQILESECAAIAAQRRTMHDLIQMEKSLQDMMRYETEEDLGLEADLQFHFYVVRSTGNSTLTGIMHMLSNNMKETIRATRHTRFSQPGRFMETFQEHENIFLAIRDREPDRARRATADHITKIQEEMLKERGFW